MRAIPDLLAKRAELSPDKIAIDAIGVFACPYAILERDSRKAAGLISQFCGPGDRVASICRNRLGFFEILFGCAKAGAVAVPLNWRSPAEELRPLLDQCRPKIIFHDAGNEEAVREASKDLGAVLVNMDNQGEGGWHDLLGKATPMAGRREWPADEAWYLLYTSGTTGKPKAVINTYGMALANMVNIGACVGLTSADTTITYLPVFHAAGMGLHTLPTLFLGGTVIVLPKFDVDTVVELLAAGRINAFFGVPSVYREISLHPAFESLDLTRVRHWCCGGAPLPDHLVHLFAARDALVCNGMGMTETGPTAFVMDQAGVRAKVGSVGKPQLLSQVRLVDAQGEDVAPGETGEVWFSGSAVTPGYWRDDEATRALFSADGWLKSGDLARKDEDGYYFVVGRLKEMFISGGENVYPAEVENVLLAHPDVLEAAVVPVPDARWGEVGRAYVALRPEATIDAEGLAAYCRERLAGFKVPKVFTFVEVLPRNALGKVLKHRLAEPAA